MKPVHFHSYFNNIINCVLIFSFLLLCSFSDIVTFSLQDPLYLSAAEEQQISTLDRCLPVQPDLSALLTYKDPIQACITTSNDSTIRGQYTKNTPFLSDISSNYETTVSRSNLAVSASASAFTPRYNIISYQHRSDGKKSAFYISLF